MRAPAREKKEVLFVKIAAFCGRFVVSCWDANCFLFSQCSRKLLFVCVLFSAELVDSLLLIIGMCLLRKSNTDVLSAVLQSDVNCSLSQSYCLSRKFHKQSNNCQFRMLENLFISDKRLKHVQQETVIMYIIITVTLFQTSFLFKIEK